MCSIYDQILKKSGRKNSIIFVKWTKYTVDMFILWSETKKNRRKNVIYLFCEMNRVFRRHVKFIIQKFPEEIIFLFSRVISKKWNDITSWYSVCAIAFVWTVALAHISHFKKNFIRFQNFQNVFQDIMSNSSAQFTTKESPGKNYLFSDFKNCKITRKSSCLTARGVLPVAWRGESNPGPVQGRRVPYSSVLVLSGGGGGILPSPVLRVYPKSFPDPVWGDAYPLVQVGYSPPPELDSGVPPSRGSEPGLGYPSVPRHCG